MADSIDGSISRLVYDVHGEKKMIALVGYTGFVGSNIYAASGDRIDALYNSKNIAEATGTKPDLLIYAGLRAEKYLANTNPEADMALIEEAKENIRKIAPKELVLISTVDVLKDPNGRNEDTEIETLDLHPYGFNRYRLEQWVRAEYPEALMIRLPGLYGKNLKKNFIYDYINVIPFMLKADVFERLSSRGERLREYYADAGKGFFKCKELETGEREMLKEAFRNLGFTALNFTDSRNVYQFYPLSRLWADIQIARKNHLTLLHPATEPVSAAELYRYLCGQEFVNEIAQTPVYYDYRTKYAEIFGGQGAYLMTKDEVMRDIKKFATVAL